LRGQASALEEPPHPCEYLLVALIRRPAKSAEVLPTSGIALCVPPTTARSIRSPRK